jgi:hypothetical protein
VAVAVCRWLERERASARERERASEERDGGGLLVT